MSLSAHVNRNKGVGGDDFLPPGAIRSVGGWDWVISVPNWDSQVPFSAGASQTIAV